MGPHIPDAPLTVAQMAVFWLIVGTIVLVGLILGDAIARGRS